MSRNIPFLKRSQTTSLDSPKLDERPAEIKDGVNMKIDGNFVEQS